MSLRLRSADLNDADILLRWRNHPLCRSQSFSNEIITFDTHLSWLTQSLVNPKTFLCIAEWQGIAVGQVRANIEADNRIFLSWVVAPDRQGEGLGRQILQTLSAASASTLYTRIKAPNLASAKIAQVAGFAFIEQTPTFALWCRQPRYSSEQIALETQQWVDAANNAGGAVRLFY